jgi:hypothetical protein
VRPNRLQVHFSATGRRRKLQSSQILNAVRGAQKTGEILERRASTVGADSSLKDG